MLYNRRVFEVVRGRRQISSQTKVVGDV